MGLPGGSAGKESTCNMGGLDSILGWEEIHFKTRIIKMLKVKDKKRIIEAAGKKYYIKGSPHKTIRFFSTNFLEGKSYSKCWKKIFFQPRILYLATVIQD